MKKIHFIISALPFLLAGCEKEIEINYRSIEELYVIEGYVTNETAEVVITRTRDMNDPAKGNGIEVAAVEISADDGTSEILTYETDGFYRASSEFSARSGIAYTLSALIDGKQYVSRSTMQKPTGIESVVFQWEKFMNTKQLICIVEVNDMEGEEDYYWYRMYRNDKIYRWNVVRDRGYDGQMININIPCMSERMIEDNKEDDRDEILNEGDEITIEIRTIDRKAYDYLYSVGLSERTSSNPIDDFSGGCLGFFSAYHTVQYDTIFEYGKIE